MAVQLKNAGKVFHTHYAHRREKRVDYDEHINRERVILHSDCNSFYASVEELYDPDLRRVPLAVAGDPETRHGIILAKNQWAKMYGVATGEAVWEAKRKCANLVVVPPHYDWYMQMSRLCRKIYSDYTDRVEPMGMDECFLDLTGCEKYLGKSGREAADEIRTRVREELGITVSVGVSFNKVFAKLGSDLKKPDATTEITPDNFRERLWGLPADSMLGVGRATYKKLRSAGIVTLGQLASVPEELLEAKFGKIGLWLWAAVRGLERGEVATGEESLPIKSVGHSSNALRDLENDAEVWSFMLWISQELAYRMRKCGKKAYGIMVSVRENDLSWYTYQKKFGSATSNDAVIAEKAFEVFREKHKWRCPLRSVGIHGIYLDELNAPEQLTVSEDGEKRERLERLDRTLDELNDAFGFGTVTRAACIRNPCAPGMELRELVMPNARYM